MPGPRNLICSDTMAAEDATGDLVSCHDAGAFAYPSPTVPNVTNASDDPTTIHIWWGFDVLRHVERSDRPLRFARVERRLRRRTHADRRRWLFGGRDQ